MPALPRRPAPLQTAPRPPEVPQLRTEQELAIDAIVRGASEADVAKHAGVQREIVRCWRHSDPEFIAGLNLRRVEVWEAARDDLRSLLRKAAEGVSAALGHSDARIRLRGVDALLELLQVAGRDLAPGTTLTDANSVRQLWEDRERMARNFRETDEMLKACGIL